MKKIENKCEDCKHCAIAKYDWFQYYFHNFYSINLNDPRIYICDRDRRPLWRSAGGEKYCSSYISDRWHIRVLYWFKDGENWERMGITLFTFLSTLYFPFMIMIWLSRIISLDLIEFLSIGFLSYIISYIFFGAMCSLGSSGNKKKIIFFYLFGIANQRIYDWIENERVSL